MLDGKDEIRWHPRVPQAKIRRLYESDADGSLDVDLLDDVATALYLRCMSIVMVGDAQQGRVHCPRCYNNGKSTVIPRDARGKDFLLMCPTCSWRAAWGEYLESNRGKQLSIGGAGVYFREYLEAYRKARSPKERMLAVDRVIHQFHYNTLKGETVPTRANCVNLIQGTLTQTVEFLNQLTNGPNTPHKQEWSETLQSMKAPHPKPLKKQ